MEPNRTPEEGYHLTEDLADKAIKWVRQQKALMPDKPFFAYFAPGATHAPHHVPAEWSEKYKGAFDDGWDALRGRIFELVSTPDGDPGLNYLCAGYKDFFHHVDGPMRFMARQLRQSLAPADVMRLYASEDARRGRNDPCTCGSGRKWKHCHGGLPPG